MRTISGINFNKILFDFAQNGVDLVVPIVIKYDETERTEKNTFGSPPF